MCYSDLQTLKFKGGGLMKSLYCQHVCYLNVKEKRMAVIEGWIAKNSSQPRAVCITQWLACV